LLVKLHILVKLLLYKLCYHLDGENKNVYIHIMIRMGSDQLITWSISNSQFSMTS